MGMDVYGKAPTSEAGEYFRNNIWWWRPLAEFLTDTYPELTYRCEYWHTNDGDGLDAEGSTALAHALTRDLDNGTVDAYAANRAETLAALPLQECWLCHGTGARTDEIGRQHGLDKPGGCNGCQGAGKTPHRATQYPFSVENVREFTDFLTTCGGFEIW